MKTALPRHRLLALALGAALTASALSLAYAANPDGQITRAEFEAMHQRMLEDRLKRFDAADTDRDGVLSAAERKALRAEMRESRHAGRHGRRDECRGAGPDKG